MGKKPKAKKAAAKKPAHTFRNAAEAEAWADKMQADIKAGSRPNDAATLSQIESARATAKEMRGAAGG